MQFLLKYHFFLFSPFFVGNFLKKASPHPSKTFETGLAVCPRIIFATNKFVGLNKKYPKSKRASFVGYFFIAPYALPRRAENYANIGTYKRIPSQSYF